MPKLPMDMRLYKQWAWLTKKLVSTLSSKEMYGFDGGEMKDKDGNEWIVVVQPVVDEETE